MYCKYCELQMRRGFRPDPACPDCRRLRAGAGQTPRRTVQDELAALALSDRARELDEAAERDVGSLFGRRPARRAGESVPPRGSLFSGSREEPLFSPRFEEAVFSERRGNDRLRGHLVCFGCHRLILPDLANEAEGKIFCGDCFAKIPSCRSCGRRVLSGASGGAVLCPDCRSSATCCDKCGAVLLASELYRCDGHTFCDDCYDRLDECELCGNKVFLYDENAATLLCSECLMTHISCEACGRIIPRDACALIDGHPVCPECRDSFDDCEDCGAPVFAPAGEPHPRICRVCMRHYVCCDVCRDAIPKKDAERYVIDGKILCENCYDDLPECEECYAHFFPDADEERGDTVCRACRDNYTRCDECGKRLLFTDAYEKEGRLLCAECIKKEG